MYNNLGGDYMGPWIDAAVKAVSDVINGPDEGE